MCQGCPTLEQMSTFKYLGITISGNLTWSTHILATCCKAKHLIGFLYCNLRDVSRRCIEYRYKTIVQPVLQSPPGQIHLKTGGGSNICSQTCHQAVAYWLRLTTECPALATSLCLSLVPQIMRVQTDPLWTITNFIFRYSSPLAYCFVIKFLPLIFNLMLKHIAIDIFFSSVVPLRNSVPEHIISLN